MCVYVLVWMRIQLEKVVTYDFFIHTIFFETVCRANKHTNQFNFRWLNFSLDKRTHNSNQYIYSISRLSSGTHGRILSVSLPRTHIHTTYMIYVIYPTLKSMRHHHALYLRFSLTFLFVVVVGSSIWYFSLVRKHFAEKRTSRGAL